MFRHTTSGSIDFIQKSWKVGATGLKERRRNDTQNSQEKIYPFQKSVIQPNEIKVLKELGLGGSSTVHLISYRDEQFALKVINLDDEKHEFKSAQSEIETLRCLQNQYVVTMRQAYIRNRRIAIILDYMNCASLDVAYKKMGRITPKCSLAQQPHKQARGITNLEVLSSIISLTLLGLLDMFKHNVCHRDIKPSNLLLHSFSQTDGLVRITDFGLARLLGKNELCTEIVGTTKYHSPERMSYQGYDMCADIWSLGVSIAELFLGRYPFSHQLDHCTEDQFRKFICSNPLEHETFPSHLFPSDLLQFITACMQHDPTRRATPEQLLQFPCLSHAQNEDHARMVIGKWIEESHLKLPKVSNPVSIRTSTPRGRRASMVQQFFSVSCDGSPGVMPMSLGSSLGLGSSVLSQHFQHMSMDDDNSLCADNEFHSHFNFESDPCGDETHQMLQKHHQHLHHHGDFIGASDRIATYSPSGGKLGGGFLDRDTGLPEEGFQSEDHSFLPKEDIEIFGFQFEN